ncbi:hypothetical protein EDC18_102212 [Natranaerovirga pectinivora]|uniref:Uncharacterized protein n=1 Tax=Natranaerovirga pectinivora TaxID=682400 RepID=A0A4R3MQM8_9FIRM|nr:geobacillin-26 family protein [Natranaerovirga pectinivora]TCT16196.1 hypothetical protein EDC18_102212 [Natranaerovirga pectinivora]
MNIKRYKKNIISFAFIIILSLNMTFAVSGQTKDTNYNTIILQDDEQVRIAQANDDNMIYTTTFNKIDNWVQTIATDIYTGEQFKGDIVFIQIPEQEFVVGIRASLKENTFTNYEYTKTYGTTNKWELRRPRSNIFNYYYFKTDETTANSSDLSRFKSYVDSINTLEGQIIMDMGLSGLSIVVSAAAGAGAIFTGGTLSTAAWASIVASAGAHSKLVSTCMSYDTACKNAYDAYWTVYYKSDVYF